NSLVFFKPCPPYDQILGFLAETALETGENRIYPRDCETRTFLHDLPVVDRFTSDCLAKALGERKSVIIHAPELKGTAVLAHGSISPEQGFVTTSSVCFAGFIKFFSDYMEALESGKATPKDHRQFDAVAPLIPQRDLPLPPLATGPFKTEAEVYKALVQAGRALVDQGLVDSYFGNISYTFENKLYISQTGSSLDELEGCIDPVPLDGSTCAGLTASSELSAHLETLKRVESCAILHGHPKFSVILSMDCQGRYTHCPNRNQCHKKCTESRQVDSVPIVPGEVGTGPFGLCNTLPRAFKTSEGVIAFGHGVFTRGQKDFISAFSLLARIESRCRTHYFNKIKKLRA
ncbi:MAG: class II aldolase/adducin family protein, partial [Desulfovibrionales bacterium]|nr:class II aldolase/adducin family protein [Desulfovibrionales bacterium]